MKKIQKHNFLEFYNETLIKSFKKIDLNIILIVVLDALFYFFSGYLVLLWLQRIQEKMVSFNLPADFISLGYKRGLQLTSDVKGFYFLIVASFILLLLAIIFLASIIKGIIWAKTTKTKISFALISKFLGLNLIWMNFWFLLVFLISWLVERASAPAFTIAAIILGLYFTNTLYALFMKEQKLKTIFKAVKLSAAKIHLFAIPYALIIAVFYLIGKLSNLIRFRYSPILVGLTVIVYAAFVRYYASEMVLEIERL